MSDELDKLRAENERLRRERDEWSLKALRRSEARDALREALAAAEAAKPEAPPTDAEVKEWRLNAMATPPQAHHVLSPSTLRVVHVSQISEAVRLMRRARVDVPGDVKEVNDE